MILLIDVIIVGGLAFVAVESLILLIIGGWAWRFMHEGLD